MDLVFPEHDADGRLAHTARRGTAIPHTTAIGVSRALFVDRVTARYNATRDRDRIRAARHQSHRAAAGHKALTDYIDQLHGRFDGAKGGGHHRGWGGGTEGKSTRARLRPRPRQRTPAAKAEGREHRGEANNGRRRHRQRPTPRTAPPTRAAAADADDIGNS